VADCKNAKQLQENSEHNSAAPGGTEQDEHHLLRQVVFQSSVGEGTFEISLEHSHCTGHFFYFHLPKTFPKVTLNQLVNVNWHRIS